MTQRSQAARVRRLLEVERMRAAVAAVFGIDTKTVGMLPQAELVDSGPIQRPGFQPTSS